ncbi:MAG: hydroxymethylbilane synthase [Planctomycetota bacterium]|nr:hydroxymethylbilane synthase [Planctomycetota bacterium]
MRRLVIATRGSELALWQARHVREALQRAHPGLEVELKIVHTQGDKVLDVPLQALDKGMFTREIQVALLEESADLAVHSLKDLPTEPVEGLALGAVCTREDPADALITKGPVTLEALPHGAKVLSGSPRRIAQVLHRRPDVQVLPLRGNIQTRLRKFDESDAAAMLLARAGLVRLGLAGRISARLDPGDFVPACAQGALGVEIRLADSEVAALLGPLNDVPVRLAVTAERAFLKALGGGCKIPAGAFARFERTTLTIVGMVAALDGARLVKQTLAGEVASASAAETLGLRLGQAVLQAGGREILKAVDSQASHQQEEEV